MIVDIILVVCIIVLLLIILYKSKLYKNLLRDIAQDKIIIATLSEFVVHTKEHSDKEIMLNDMVNAIKVCVNKDLYSITYFGDNQISDNAYRDFAENMFKIIFETNEEWLNAGN